MAERAFVKCVLVVAATMVACLLACSRTDQKTPTPLEKITIAYSSAPDAVFAAVAQVRGYYREEGLEATPHMHAYGKLALQDVLEGKADFATVAETPVMFAILKGEKISLIASIETSDKNNAVVARRDRGILAVEDLKGRKIAATLGTTSDFLLDTVLAVHGISRKSVKVIDLKADDIPAALLNGDVDAASIFPPYMNYVQKKLGTRGIKFVDRDIYMWTFNIVARQEFIHNNPGKVKKLLRALIRAEEFVIRNPEEAQRIVADFARMDISLVREIWADIRLGVSLDQSLLLALEDEAQWAINNKLTSAMKIPNFLDYIYLDGLQSVKPEAVRIVR